MAEKCPPYPGPRLMDRMERNDPSGMAVAAVRQGEIEGKNVKPRKGFGELGPKEYEEIAPLLQMNVDDAQAWFVENKILTKTGKAIFGTDGETTGKNGKIVKTYLEQIAGGAKQLADAFLNKVQTGADATVEGMAFAQQMKAISKFGDAVLGYDQAIGRNMLRQRDDWYTGIKGNTGRKFREMDAKQEAMQEQINVFEQINNDLSGGDTIAAINALVGLAKRVQFADRPDKIVRSSAGLGQVASNVVGEFFINGLLSSPATFTTNASGALWVPMKVIFTTAGAPFLALTGDVKTAKVAMQQGLAGLSALQASFWDSLQIGWHSLKTERAFYGASRDPAIYVGPQNPAMQRFAEQHGLDTASTVTGTINTLGRAVRAPSNLLLGSDQFAQHMASRAEVAMRGVRNAFDEGVDMGNAKAVKRRVQQEADEAFNLPSYRGIRAGIKKDYDIKSKIKYGKSVSEYAAEGVFQEQNGVADGVNKIVQKFPPLRGIVPFVKTPSNIIKQGLYESTGIKAGKDGLSALGQIAGAALTGGSPQAKVLEYQQQMLRNPQEAARMAGQIAFTTSLMAWVFMQSQSVDEETGRPVLTGGGPARYYGYGKRAGIDAQALWEGAGNTRYAIQLGTTTIPFDRFGEPLSIALRMMADLGQLTAFIPQEKKDPLIAAYAGTITTGLYNSSFMQNLGDFIEIFGAEPNEQERLLTNNVRNYVAAFTPMAGLLGFIERQEDPYKAAREGASLEELFIGMERQAELGVLSTAAMRFPGNELPPRVDQILGEPVPMYPGMGPEGLSYMEGAVPFWPRQADKANPAAFAWQQIVGSYTDYVPDRNKIDLTIEEKMELNRRMGKLVIGGKTFSQRVMEIYNRPDVQQFIKDKGTVYGKVDSPYAKELNKIRLKYGKAAYSSMQFESVNDPAGIVQRLSVAAAQKSAKDEGRLQEAEQIRTQLDDLYNRARRGY